MAADDSPVGDERDEALTKAALIETVLALVPDPTVIVDDRGVIVAVNDHACALFDHARDSLVGQPIEVLVPERYRSGHRSHRSSFLAHPRMRPMGAGFELYGRRRDGTEFPVDISLAPIAGDGRRLAVAAVRDITERRRIEQDLRRLLAASEHHAHWQEAAAEIRLAALAGDPVEQVLDLVVTRTLELMGATGVALVRRSGEVVAASGPARHLIEDLAALPAEPSGDGGLRYRDPKELGGPWDELFAGGSVVVVPVRDAHHQVADALVCARTGGPGVVSPDDAAVLTSMAQHATMAVELGQARDDRERLLLADDRERIARDLHDHAVQGLFATGLSLQGILPLIDNPRVAERVNAAVDSLDATIKQIRTAIFTLSAPTEPRAGLRAEVVRLAAQAARGLDFDPTVLFDGPVDVSVPADVANHIVAVVREALSNVARHARASSASVELRVTPTRCEVVVSDDGIGFEPSGIGNGLANLRSRAAEAGGDLDVTGEPGRGTRLTWRVPLR